MRMPAGTNTVFFVKNSAIPKERVVTYAQLFAIFCPHKSEVYSVRCTVGVEKLDLPSITTTNCASLTTSKILINSNLSTPNAIFLTLDIKEFYYYTYIARFEFMKLALDIPLPKIVDQYNLNGLACPASLVYL